MCNFTWNVLLPICTLVNNATVGNEKDVTYKDLTKETIAIIRSCTMLDKDNAVLLAGEFEDFLESSSLQDLPVALISESKATAFDLYTLSRYSYKVFQNYTFIKLLWKLNQFVVIASSQTELRLLLQKIKDSSWANFNGFHILIDRKTEELGCANAYRFLWTAWEYDRLSTVFLCIDSSQGLLLYTYNPYSNSTTPLWEYAGSYEGRNRHPWILFKRKFRDGSSVCKDLMFDKKTKINGYEVRLNAVNFPPHLTIDPSKSGMDQFSGVNSDLLKIVFEKLNATLKVQIYNDSIYHLGGIDNKGNVHGLMAGVANGEVDMGMNVRSLHAMWKVEYTYPHAEDGLCVLTRRAGEVSELAKITSYMSPTVIVASNIVVLFTYGVLIRYQGIMPASLNIIRLITMVSISRPPQALPFRIFLSNVFTLLLIMNALFQSHLSSLLTVPVQGTNIKTVDQLKQANYQIYGSEFHFQELQDPVLRARFHSASYKDCKRQALFTENAACLGDCLHLYLRRTGGLLKRSDPIQRVMQVYVTREDWTLFDNVTELVHYTVVSGLANMWHEVSTRAMNRAWRKRVASQDVNFRNLKLRHIAFNFYFLAGGCSLAIIAFAIEIVVARWRHRRTVH